jgi:hypothetical protein
LAQATIVAVAHDGTEVYVTCRLLDSRVKPRLLLGLTRSCMNQAQANVKVGPRKNCAMPAAVGATAAAGSLTDNLSGGGCESPVVNARKHGGDASAMVQPPD